MSNADFIETKGSLDRVNKVLSAIRSGNPILLEGPTGTSKTRTAIVASKKNGQEPIVMNFSSQTTIEDLIGRITKDPDSWGGFSFSNGPYTKAFAEGHCLILDEINLAYENVLQCIEASLDSGKLFLEISGSETKVVNMHPNFHLIATQNPLTGRFSQKRQFLSSKFKSRFQKINFVDIEKDELLEIAKGLSNDLDVSEEIIEKIVDFHFIWKEKEANENQIHVFTIREISGTIKSMREGLSPYESVIIHYGSRYDIEKLKNMNKILIDLGINPTESKLKLPIFDEKLLYMTKSINRAILNSIHLLKTKHPILITGPDGCGKTSFARWIAQIYNSEVNQDSDEDEEKKESNKESDETKEEKETTENTVENKELDKTEEKSTEENKEIDKTEEKNSLLDEIDEKNAVEKADKKDEEEKTEVDKTVDKNAKNEERKKAADKKKQQPNKTNVFICNPEVSISDIIGRYMPVMGASGEAPIMWIDGPVVSSLKKGDCLIMDQISIAPSTILERMNSLYDSFNSNDVIFSVQENSEENSIPIHPNFRIIATSSIDDLNDISPALLNRFTIVYIDNQLDELFSDKKEITEPFVRFLAPPSPVKADINLITEFIIKNRTEMTMSRISLIVKGFFSLKKEFPRSFSKSVLNFCISATSGKQEFPTMDDEKFIQTLLTKLVDNEKDTAYDAFIFKEASATRKIMAVLVASMIAGFHVVLIGKTGLGKTSAAIALSNICEYSKGRQFISFNGETKLEELFGFFTIEKGNFTSHAGPLSDAMESGKIFIADELNLADQAIIQSLNVAIEPSKNEEIILPVIGKNVVVNEHFFFIGCQNDITMYGRKPLPQSFKKKVLCINYPENSYIDLLSLTKSLAEQNNIDPKFSDGTTDMIEQMKKSPIFRKKVWSLREVRKLYRRTYFISKNLSSFTGFTIYTNAAFLLRSAFLDTQDISQKVADLVAISFKLTNVDHDTLLKNLESEVSVKKNKERSIIKLVKNELSLTIKNSELMKIPESLQSFWLTLFEVYITHPSEPLLFVGPSGFKTFLAKVVLPRAPVVYLHNDTTISSLIGQITLLDKDQARQFLLESLYNFAGSAPKDEFKELFKEIRESEVIDLEKINQVLNFINNPSFTNIVENVIQQLIDIDYAQTDFNLAFSNYLSIFKPGLITKNILKQNSLILRNIAQPSPTVLERLNELLSVKPVLTLSEDTSNTFAPVNNKVISNLSNSFRLIGICLPREKNGLSEAMLSRLTEISVPKYTNEDQKKVIDSILLQSVFNDDKSIDLYRNLLNKVSQIFIDQKEKLSMTIPFVRIIEIVRIAIEWRKFFNKYDKIESEESLFNLALFRCAAGPLPYNNKKIFIESFFTQDSGLTINDDLKKLFDDETEEETYSTFNNFLVIDDDEDKRVIRSTLSGCFIPTPLLKLPESNICFTPSIKDMIDTIISASIINHPLILEGPNGSGKSSSFFYLSKCIDANIVHISISSSTTVEDLFGKYEPNTSSDSLRFDFQQTEFLNAIRSDKDSSSGFSSLKKQWIIIEELHLASAAVLDSLAPVFNTQTDQITLSDGTIVAKGEYFIVGLVSQPLQNQSIINSSIIYKTRDYTENEYKQIYKSILSHNNLNDEIANYFSDQMHTLMNLSATSQFKIPVTVREVYKFLNLFEGSEGKMNIDKIIRILCLGRFTNSEFLDKAKDELNYNDDNYKIPDVSIDIATYTLVSDGIPMQINAASSSKQYYIQYLSSTEKELFAFLSMALKKYTPIVIQGPTASGKTYSVQLFADIIGKPLRIIQLNSEITSQAINGSFQPSNNLSPQEMDELKEILHSILDLPNLPSEFASKIEDDEISKWSPKDFKNLRSILQKNLDQFNGDDQKKATFFIKKVDNLLQFYNHLKRTDSVIIKAMLEGSWLLLDGIEAAPSDFFDRLYTLIDDKPLLNLYEHGNGFVYSYDSIIPERKIHPNFRLIMTFNNFDASSNANMSSSLLSRCTVFSIKSIDNNLRDSSLIIFSFLNELTFDELSEDSSELSIKLGKTHMAAKEFTSNSQFSVTGRTLIHLCHNLKYCSSIPNESIDNSKLKSIIEFNYGSLMNDSNKFLDAVDEKFKQVIDVNILEFIKKAQLSTSRGCIEIINLIDNFINSIKENIQAKFDFETFLHWLLQIHLKDIETVHDKIHYTLINTLIQKISDYSKIEPSIKKLLSHWSSIKCIEILVDEISRACQENFGNEFSKNETLSSPQVQNILAFQIILKKIRCILLLIQKEVFMRQSLPFLFFDGTKDIFLSIFKKIDEKKPIQEIYKLVKDLEKTEEGKFLFNFQGNPIYFLDSIVHFHESDNWPLNINTTMKMIASCLFFNDENCKYLFRGISKDFFLSFLTLLNDDSDITIFNDLIDYTSTFYKLLEVDSSITLDEFISCFEKRSNSEQKQFNKYFQNLRTFNNKSINFEPIAPIQKAVNDLYQKFNDKYSILYLQRQKDQDAAKELYKILESINNRLESETELTIPLELFAKLASNIEITSTNFAFLKQIYQSIKVSNTSNINNFIWPQPHSIKFSDEAPSFPLIQSLINYSMKEKLDFKNTNWMELCSIQSNTEYFLEQFLDNEISQESIIKYKMIIKAQLLYDLSKIQTEEKYKYCSYDSIIDFFNSTLNRFTNVDQKLIDLAHHYEVEMDRNFVIKIPIFDKFDVISLLINPIDHTLGPIFADVTFSELDQEYLAKFYNELIKSDDLETSLFDLAKYYLNVNNIHEFDDTSFQNLCNYVTSKNSIEKHIQDVVQAIFDASEITKIVISSKHSGVLRFDDVPSKFDNEYIDNQPFPGFYIASHYEVLPEVTQILELCGPSSFPLSLFIFREYTNQNIIEIDLSSSFPLNNISHEVEDFLLKITNIINTNLNNKKITKFSNLIGFLLDQRPLVLNTHRSEHFRDILLDILAKPLKQIFIKYIMEYLNENIEDYILTIGSDKWNKLINEDFTQKASNSNKFLKFLVNPWSKIAEFAQNKFKEEKEKYSDQINKLFDRINNHFSLKYANRGFFNKVLQSKMNDEKELQRKIRDEYMRSYNEINDELMKDKMEITHEAWKNYSSYIKKELTLIPEFPGVSHSKFANHSSFEEFYKHLSKNKISVYSTSDQEETLIVIVPKKTENTKNNSNNANENTNNSIVNIYYTKHKTTASGTLVNNISIVRLPKNKSIEDLNISSDDADFYYHHVFYESNVEPVQKFSIKGLNKSYEEYSKLIDNTSIDVKFKNNDYVEFKDKINDIDKKAKDLISNAGSNLEKMSKSCKDLANKMKEIEDFFPANFENEVEKPKETNACLEQFKEFMNKTIHDLNEIKISQDLIDADNEFIINAKSEFRKILSSVQRFALKSKPVIDEGSTQYTRNEFNAIKNLDKLIIPTIFLNEDDDFCLNINHLQVKLGPYIKYNPYSNLKFKIINLTQQNISCIYHQDNTSINLSSENENGFFNLIIPIDKIYFENDNDSEFRLTGKIDFYSINSKTAFKSMTYDITLFYMIPTIYFNIQNYSFAIKDGEAQVLPYYSVENSNIVINAKPLSLPLKLIELPNNTAKEPKLNTDKINAICTLPTTNSDEDHLEAQIDFGLSNSLSVPISLNLDIKTNKSLLVAVYCDKFHDFRYEGACVTIGNLSRDVYFMISYFNPLNIQVEASISFATHKSEFFEMYTNEVPKFEPYSRSTKIFSFKSVLNKLPRSRIQKENKLIVRIGSIEKIVKFQMYLGLIFVNQKKNEISNNKFHDYCSYLDGDQFIEYKKSSTYYKKEINLLVSPVNFEFSHGDPNKIVTVYYESGVFSGYKNNAEFEVLTLDFTDEKDPIKIFSNPNKKLNLKQKEGKPIRLFARIKNKPNTAFPLFGENVTNKIDVSKINFYTQLDKCLNWFYQFFPEYDINNNIISLNKEFDTNSNTFPFNCNSNPSSHNFSYLIWCFISNTMKVPYKKLVNAIKEFTGSDLVEKRYKKINRVNNLACKLVSILWAIYELIIYQINALRKHNFVINFPISNECLFNEQKRLLEKCKLDRTSALNANEYKACLNKIDNYNNKRKEEFKKNNYSISPYAKWTYQNKFQEITEEEFSKNGKNIQRDSFKEEISPQYSNEAGNIEIQNVSFENMNTILNTYQAFDSILKNSYQCTISIHSSLLKKNQKQLESNVRVFNQLISFYLWVKEIEEYSPYPAFFNKFFSAYQSMISRLQSSEMKIRDNHLYKIGIDKVDFIENPHTIKNFEFFRWIQAGKKQKQIQNEGNQNINNNNNKQNKPEQPNIQIEDLGKFVKHLSKIKENDEFNYPVEITKQISFSSNTAEEIPNKDYIEYIVNKMINPGRERKSIEIFDDDKTHIPIHYDIERTNGSIKKIDDFFNAAETLSSVILDGIAVNSKLYDSIDNCYASILVDCSNTFSLIQKASLILLTISYGNALTALRIPYSIIIFCDDNFQFILKKLEDNHEKIYYLKLIEAMTVNRRMSSMNDAIQMAQQKVIPSPNGPYANRKNHVIYTFSDGLSTKLNLIDEWKEIVLNNNLATVSFYFLNIVSEDKSNKIVNIWSKFANGIENSISPTTIFYSTYEEILTSKQISKILPLNNNKNTLIKQVSLSECFSEPIIQSNNNQIMPISLIKGVKKLESYKFDVKYPAKILESLSKIHSNESKYYKDSSDESQIDEPEEIEIPSVKIEPFYTNLVINEDPSERNLYSSFHTELFKLSTILIDQSNLQEMTSYLFMPNKPSQYTPSSDGTLFYFPGLIRFLLTQGQDTKIFLEKKAGLIRSYSVFVVIDCSTSCFNFQSSFHAIQSIFILLQTLSKIDLPSFNLIITTYDGPRILCCEKSTFDALSPTSPIWITLFSYLLNPHEDSYLDSALLSVLAIRSQQKTLSSILFVFTDGSFSSRKQRLNNSILEFISSYHVEEITIGIGSNSSNISSLSTKKVWSLNPRNIINAILAAYGKETNELIPNITSLFIYKQIDDYKEIGLVLSSYLEYKSIDDYILKELIIELNSITRDVSVFADLYNIKNDGDQVYSEDSSNDIGKKDIFVGVKILICQFWDESMSYNENKLISKDVLINGTDKNHRSVYNSLKDFGIETDIVQNYQDAINGLSSGQYSQVWIICGRFDGKMPDKSKTANLASSFIDALIIYWNSGGGIVFWTDNSPLVAEVNFFLSKATFDNNEQAKFRIGGSYPGNTYLHKSRTPRKQTFTAEQQIQCDGYKKWLFNANMQQIFEGKTIASAIIPPADSKNECYDEDNERYQFANVHEIHPFRYFSISSSGGFSSLYYNAPLNSSKGDIVIDCGFSKLFFELKEESIYHYVRNIAYFMLSIEKKMSMIGGSADPRKMKPKEFELQARYPPPPKFYSYNTERAVDIVFLIDATGSMKTLIEAVTESCNDIAQYCKDNFPDNSFRFGAVIYRDNAVKEIKCNLLRKPCYDDTDYSDLNKNIVYLQDFLTNVKAYGGGNDGPEDWLSGYDLIEQMRWRENSEKVVIHIADAPSHGISFNNHKFNVPYFTNDPEENEKLYLAMDTFHDREFPNYIKRVAQRGIRLFCLSAKSALISFKKVEEIYKKANGKQFNLTKINFYSENIDDEQKVEILKIVKNIAYSSIDSAVAVFDKKPGKKPLPTLRPTPVPTIRPISKPKPPLKSILVSDIFKKEDEEK